MKAVGKSILYVIIFPTSSCAPSYECNPTDYECNYQAYISEISRKPPDYHRAPKLAIQTEPIIRQNVYNVLNRDDYISSTMLRILAAYPASIRSQICNNSKYHNILVSRMTSIRSPFQRQEYFHLLRDIGCSI